MNMENLGFELEENLQNCQKVIQQQPKDRTPDKEELNSEKVIRKPARQHVTFELETTSHCSSETPILKTSITNSTAATANADLKPGFRGWSVVFGCFLVEGLIYGTLRALPVYFLDLQETFQASSSQVSWILSITLAVLHVSGPAASVLCQSFDCRVVVITGGILACVGFLVSSYTTHIAVVYIGTGIITGAGFGFAFIPSNVCVGEYFRNNSSLAYCICSVGGPIMSLAFAPLFEMLGNRYGWRGAFLVIAGIVLNISGVGILMVMPRKNKDQENQATHEPKKQKKTNKGLTQLENIEEETQPSKPDLNALESFRSSKLSQKTNNNDEDCPKESTGKFELLRNFWFLMYCVTGICIGAGAFTPSVFFVPYLRSIGFTSSQSTWMLSISSAVSLFSSLFAGWISSRPNINILYVDALSLTSLAVCCFLPAIITSYNQLMIFSILLGMCTGMVLALPFSVLAEIIGNKNLSFGLGLFLLATSISVLFTPPLTGWLVDISGSYCSTFYFAGSSMILGVLTILIIQYGTEVVDGKVRKEEIATVDRGQSNISEMLDHRRLSTVFGHLPYQIYIGHQNAEDEQIKRTRYRKTSSAFLNRSHSRLRSSSLHSIPSIDGNSNRTINLSSINMALARRKSMF